MTIDLLVGETLERKLADVRVPRTDVDAARRSGRRRRRRRGGVLAGTVFLAAFGTTMALLVSPAPEPVEPPSDIPAMDFSLGVRGVYDDETGRVALGGQVVALDDAADLGASAVATPYGLVYFTVDQTVRLLGADGHVQTLAPAPARAEPFTPTVRYDNSRQSVAWLTRSNGRVTLSVYSLVEPLSLIGSHTVPCESECGSLRMGGQDQGLAFVAGDAGTLVIDPAAGADAEWSKVTDGRVVDVRNKTILSVEPAGAQLDRLGPPFDGGWRLEAASVEDGVLTFDGSWEVGPTTTWRFLGEPTRPFELAIPPGTGPIEVAIDSDNTVLVRRTEATGDDVFYDCDYFANCTEFARFEDARGRSGIVGDVH